MTIEPYVRQTIQIGATRIGMIYNYMRGMGWAAARIIFILCSGFAVTTGIGCYLLSPLFCYWFFGSFRFWRYLHLTPSTIRFTYHLIYLCLKGRSGSVNNISWTAPPMSGPDLEVVKINPDWAYGDSCEDCGACCRNCPFQDQINARCLSYNSFYWRYFNCGRYPTSQAEINLYECPKWLMRR